MTINLKIEEYIYKFFSIFKKIFYIFLEIYCQDYQNNPLSTDPFSIIRYGVCVRVGAYALESSERTTLVGF
jgi:hypothetical protein